MKFSVHPTIAPTRFWLVQFYLSNGEGCNDTSATICLILVHPNANSNNNWIHISILFLIVIIKLTWWWFKFVQWFCFYLWFGNNNSSHREGASASNDNNFTLRLTHFWFCWYNESNEEESAFASSTFSSPSNSNPLLQSSISIIMIATVYVHLPSSLFQHRYIHRFNDSNIIPSGPIITIAAYSLTPTDVDSCSSDD